MPGRRTHLLLPLLAAGLLSCADLPVIEENRCGNGFIEAGEDCDSFGATQKNTDTSGTVATCNAPGTPNQCRWHCDSDTSGQCRSSPVSSAEADSKLPSGWRCGVDHVCRRPLGDDDGDGAFFTSASSLVPGSADRLFTGDFDGDGSADVLAVGSAGFDVHYFTRDGVLAKTLSIPTAPVVPAIGRLTTSTADDFTLDEGQGIGVMLGQLGKTVEPTSYLSLDIKKRYMSNPPDDMVFFTLDTGDGEGNKPVALIDDGDEVRVIDTAANPMPGNPGIVLAKLPGFGRKQLIGSVPVAALQPGSNHQRFALAFRDAKSILVLEGVSTAKAVESAIALPPGLTVHGAAFFADVDGDGLTDLLAGAAKCAPGPGGCSAQIVVAYGDGNGAFYGAPKVGTWDPAKLDQASMYAEVYAGTKLGPPAATVLDLEPYLPLAVGRLNNDASVDYVDAFGIFVSASTSCMDAPMGYCRAGGPAGGDAWSEAKIADLNGNGRADVVAVASGARGIDFFNGTGTGIFNTFAIPTEATPRNLTIGDFDGDFLADLAFDSVAGKMGTDVHTLFIAFGRSSGAPELPVSMGVVENLQQIAAGNVSALGSDATSDLMLLSGTPAKFDASGNMTMPGAGWKAGLSEGNGYRQLEAPLLFFSEGTINIDSSPLATAIGLFDSDASASSSGGQTPVPHADLAALTVRTKPPSANLGPPFCDYEASLWMLPATDEAAIAPPDQSSRRALIHAGAATDSHAVPEPFFPLRRLLEVQPIKVSGKGLDQLLIAFPTYKSCTMGQQPGDIGAHGELFLASFGGSGEPTLTRVKAFDDAASAGRFLIQMHVGDIDGDGFPDVAAVRAHLDFNLGQVDGTQVVVLFGDGAGKFSDPIDLGLPGFPVDLALVNVDDRSDAEIVVAVDGASAEAPTSRLFVVDWDATKKGSANPFTTLSPRGNLAPSGKVGGLVVDNPSAVVGGDFDGDGVDDVAVAVPGGIQIFKGVAK